MRNTLLVIALAFVSVFSLAETAGDYRSKTSGNWTSTSTWQTYSGSEWIDADSMGIYEIRTDSPSYIAKKANPAGLDDPYILTLVVQGRQIKGYFENTVSGAEDSVSATASFQALGTIASINGTSAVTDTVLIDDFTIETGSMELE